MKTYLCTYLGAGFLAVLLTPLLIRLARRFGAFDRTDPRKVHSVPVPRLGGVAVFLSSTVLMTAVMFLDNSIGKAFRDLQTQVITLLLSGTLIFITGLIDDLRNLRAVYKIAVQLLAAVSLCSMGIRIETLNFANLFTVEFGIFAWPITILWIVAITNAVNLIDGLDGLAAGISAVACAIIAVFAFSRGMSLMVVFMLALLGSLCGFLLFNFNPAKIFMGDCGSMYIGFMLAATSVMCAVKTGAIVALAMPAIGLGLPIFDTFFSIVRRYLGRWQIMSADRGHLHHVLLDMGLKHRHVVIIMYTVTILAAGLGMFMMITRGAGTIAIFLCELLLLVLVFRAAGAVKFHDIISKFRKKRLLIAQSNHQKQIFESTCLKFYNVRSFPQFWRLFCKTAEDMGFFQVTLSVTTQTSPGRQDQDQDGLYPAASYYDGSYQTDTNQNTATRTFFWVSATPPVQGERLITLTLPLQSENLQNVVFEVKLPVNGSLELAGRRIMLLGRLIDEHGIPQLTGQHEYSYT